jgi:hypothetical protein
MEEYLKGQAEYGREPLGSGATHWMKHPTGAGWFRIPRFIYRNLVNGGIMEGERVAQARRAEGPDGQRCPVKPR